MQRIIQTLLPVILLVLLSCNSTENSKNRGEAKIEFSQTEFDFGSIKHGEKVSHRFEFTNTGKGDLILKNVDPGCGCTVVSFPNTPIKPGEVSYIDATFDSEGFRGLNIKYIEVRTNCKPYNIQLTLSAVVENEVD